jgi:hypothetical protein
VAWLAVAAGRLVVSGVQLVTELAIFAPSEAEISVEALQPTQFVLGSAAPHPHPLALGYYSVHTSEAALERGETGIRRVQARLQAEVSASAGDRGNLSAPRSWPSSSAPSTITRTAKE